MRRWLWGVVLLLLATPCFAPEWLSPSKYNADLNAIKNGTTPPALADSARKSHRTWWVMRNTTDSLQFIQILQSGRRDTFTVLKGDSVFVTWLTSGGRVDSSKYLLHNSQVKYFPGDSFLLASRRDTFKVIKGDTVIADYFSGGSTSSSRADSLGFSLGPGRAWICTTSFVGDSIKQIAIGYKAISNLSPFSINIGAYDAVATTTTGSSYNFYGGHNAGFSPQNVKHDVAIGDNANYPNPINDSCNVSIGYKVGPAFDNTYFCNLIGFNVLYPGGSTYGPLNSNFIGRETGYDMLMPVFSGLREHNYIGTRAGAGSRGSYITAIGCSSGLNEAYSHVFDFGKGVSSGRDSSFTVGGDIVYVNLGKRDSSNVRVAKDTLIAPYWYDAVSKMSIVPLASGWFGVDSALGRVDSLARVKWVRGLNINNAKNADSLAHFPIDSLAFRTDSTKKAARSKVTDTLRTTGATGKVHTSGNYVIFSPMDSIVLGGNAYGVVVNPFASHQINTTSSTLGANLRVCNMNDTYGGVAGPSIIFSADATWARTGTSKGGIAFVRTGGYGVGNMVFLNNGASGYSDVTIANTVMTLTSAGKESLAAGGDLYSPTATLATSCTTGRLAAVHTVSWSATLDTIKNLWSLNDSVTRLATVHFRSWSATQDSIVRYYARFGKVDTLQADSINARRIIATAGINHADTAWYLVAPCPVDLWANSIKKNDNDTLLRLWDGPPKTANLYAFIVRGKPLQYTDPKLNATASSGADLGPIYARLDSLEAKLVRTRRSLAKEVKRNTALTKRIEELEKR